MLLTSSNPKSIAITFNSSEFSKFSRIFPLTSHYVFSAIGFENSIMIPSLNIVINTSKFYFHFSKNLKLRIRKPKLTASTKKAALTKAA